MTPGPDLVYECSQCGKFAVKGSIRSGNTLGARFFSDGKRLARMLPDFPYIIRCKKCKAFYWLKAENKVGEGWFIDEKDDVKWKDADRAEFLSIDEYIEAVEFKIYTTKKDEQYLRQRLWWAFNDNIRTGNEIFRNDNDKDVYESNCKLLIEILDKDEINGKILCAELYRNLGNFVECNNILETINEKEYDWIKERLKKECDKNNKYVIELEQ